MAADTTIDLIINQKVSVQASFTVKDADGVAIDLTPYTVEAKYKTDYSAADSTAALFTAEITDAANGQIQTSLSPAITAGLTVGQKYVYDVVITNTSTLYETRIVQGTFKVSPGVT